MEKFKKDNEFDPAESGEAEEIICVDCGGQYELTEENKKFFLDKGLMLPKRCKECRAKRKAQN